MIRENFEDKLQSLKDQVLDMSELAKKAITQSIQALEHQDEQQAQQVIDEDKKLNELEDEVNDTAIWLIAKEQPVAKDLRRLVVTLKVTTDIERIGDLAVNIAKSVKFIGKQSLPDEKQKVLQTASIVEQMIDKVIKAYLEEDIENAMEIAKIDDQVDQQYGESVRKMLTYMTDHPDEIGPITQLAFISRYLERAADHTTNIAEGIIYLVKGKHFDLNT